MDKITGEQRDFLDRFCDGKWELNWDTGLVDIAGSFYYSRAYIVDFIGITFGRVTRDFKCYNNKLTSLNGAPQRVGRDFDCSDNKLTSLEGAPQKVGRDFDCSFNNLTSLEGAPSYIARHLRCDGDIIGKVGTLEIRGALDPLTPHETYWVDYAKVFTKQMNSNG